MGKSTRVAYGETIAELANTNDKIVVFDADLAGATQTAIFKKAHPDKFYDLGIAEADAACTAAAFAFSGYIPFYSTFAIFGTGRAFEQIRNSIAYTNANVKIACTHSGLAVGEDGGSHQSVEDVALMRALPNMTVFSPCDEAETKKVLQAAIDINGPVYIRLGRPNTDDITTAETPFEVGKATVLKDGKDAAIIATGLMVKDALAAAEMLKADGIDAAVIDIHTIKPIDQETILKYHENVKVMVTVEDHSIIGGLGSAVAEVIAGKNGSKFERIGIMDKFGKSGKPALLYKEYGLTAEDIVAKVKANL